MSKENEQELVAIPRATFSELIKILSSMPYGQVAEIMDSLRNEVTAIERSESKEEEVGDA